MKKIKFIELDEFLENPHKALGIPENEKLEFRTPQFEREYKLEISFIPKSKEEFDTIRTLSSEVLKKMGVRVWEKNKNGEVCYLYPDEWYDYIPNGYRILSISGNEEIFTKGETDDDIRFGCLSFGFKRKEE